MPTLNMEWPLSLTPLEQVSPRIFIRFILAFPLQDHQEYDSVVKTVKFAWEATVQHFEPLSKQAINYDDSSQQNVLKLETKNLRAPFIVKDLRQPGAFPVTYQNLRDSNFPSPALDANTLFPTGLWANFSRSVPVSMVQLSFIRGGALLSFSFFHPVLDMNSVGSVLRYYAQACRQSQQPTAARSSLPPEMVADRIFVANYRSTNHTGKDLNVQRCGREMAYTILKSSDLEEYAVNDCTCRHYHFSKESLERLKTDAARLCRAQSEVPFVSTNTALMALVWRTLMVIRFPMLENGEDSVSEFAFAMDGRQQIQPSIHPETFGCFSNTVSVELPLRHVVNDGSIPELAVAIRKAINATRRSKSHLQSLIRLSMQAPDLSLVVPRFCEDTSGRTFACTSWEAADISSLDWGETFGGRCEAFRLPSDGFLYGTGVITSKLPDGGRDLFLTLPASCLDQVESDGCFAQYV